jgi:ethanolamine utilization protein EutQ (cupin superfamily)
MPTIIKNPTRIEAAGNKQKIINEFVGRVNSSTEQISIAKMKSPAGWEEPGQTPGFDEYTIVLKGLLRVETKEKIYDIKAGEGIITLKGEWIKYSTPSQEGAEYIAVCVPAFSPDTVNRDD